MSDLLLFSTTMSATDYLGSILLGFSFMLSSDLKPDESRDSSFIFLLSIFVIEASLASGDSPSLAYFNYIMDKLLATAEGFGLSAGSTYLGDSYFGSSYFNFNFSISSFFLLISSRVNF